MSSSVTASLTDNSFKAVVDSAMMAGVKASPSAPLSSSAGAAMM